jgi:hypothetical protein
MSTFRLRVELPGKQPFDSGVHEGIDRLGGSVVSVDLREIDGTAEVAEMVVDVPEAVDGAALRSAFDKTSGASLLSSRPCARDEVIGHAQQWVRGVDVAATPGLPDRLMAACPLSMVWVSSADQSEVIPAASTALEPDHSPGAATVALLTRPSSLRFTAGEVARVALLMAS